MESKAHSASENTLVNNNHTCTEFKPPNDATQLPVTMAELSASQTLLTVTGQRYSIGHKINILRSPSRESVGTDISLFSVSTLASELNNRVKLLSVRTAGDNASISRGPSPNFDLRKSKRPENIQEVWFEEPSDMIKGMAALSSAVGLTKSFSTSDIINLPGGGGGGLEEDSSSTTAIFANSFLLNAKRNAVSEIAINSIHNCGYLLDQSVRLDSTSRSCSTWVAIGDIPSTSQLPSPHGGNLPTNLHSSKSSCAPTFSPADLIRSVNKKVRQHYIRRRLLNTYKALERLSQSEFNLDKLELEAAASTKTSGGGILNDAHICASRTDSTIRRAASNRLSVPGTTNAAFKQQWKGNASSKPLTTAEERLTINDVERERGQPLSKYDRNIMIFNWLLTLEPDENTTDSYQ